MELELPSFEAYLRALVEHHRYVKVQYFTELRELITRNALVVKVDEESTG
ncbi:hypothetical protein ACFQ4C_21125 [Larkinella insperata]|uniref:Uncharacterized protein n=1 Tax=Larkinella insperata TaxID=332158 RepID=A0ABW3QBG7_9BACT